jgi:hypothetical protein
MVFRLFVGQGQGLHADEPPQVCDDPAQGQQLPARLVCPRQGLVMCRRQLLEARLQAPSLLRPGFQFHCLVVEGPAQGLHLVAQGFKPVAGSVIGFRPLAAGVLQGLAQMGNLLQGVLEAPAQYGGLAVGKANRAIHVAQTVIPFSDQRRIGAWCAHDPPFRSTQHHVNTYRPCTH